MNENDLRVIKTRERIEEAFLELLKVKPLEKITVTELARVAMINKGTFYLHYLDIFDLYRQVLLKYMEKPIRDASYFTDFFDDPEHFVPQLDSALVSGLPQISSIQQEQRYNETFADDVRTMLCRKVYETGRIQKNLVNDIKLVALFSAFLGLMTQYSMEHSREAYPVIAAMIRATFPAESKTV